MMPRRAACLIVCTLVLLTPSLAFAQSTPEKAVLTAKSGTRIPVSDILKALGEHQGANIVMDSQVASREIGLVTDGRLGVETIKGLLRAAEVQLIWEPTADGLTIHALAYRNVSRYQPDAKLVLHRGEALPKHPTMVTVVVPIRHCEGKSLFSTLRSLNHRDALRNSETYYIESDRTLVISGLSHKVRGYLQLIDRIDRPQPTISLKVTIKQSSGPKAGGDPKEVKTTQMDLTMQGEASVRVGDEEITLSQRRSDEGARLVLADGRVKTDLSFAIGVPKQVITRTQDNKDGVAETLTVTVTLRSRKDD